MSRPVDAYLVEGAGQRWIYREDGHEVAMQTVDTDSDSTSDSDITSDSYSASDLGSTSNSDSYTSSDSDTDSLEQPLPLFTTSPPATLPSSLPPRINRESTYFFPPPTISLESYRIPFPRRNLENTDIFQPPTINLESYRIPTYEYRIENSRRNRSGEFSALELKVNGVIAGFLGVAGAVSALRKGDSYLLKVCVCVFALGRDLLQISKNIADMEAGRSPSEARFHPGNIVSALCGEANMDRFIDAYFYNTWILGRLLQLIRAVCLCVRNVFACLICAA